MEHNITSDNLIVFAIVALTICWAFNLVYTAVQNARTEKKRQQEPFQRIDSSMNDIRAKCESHVREIDSRVETLERRMTEHENDLKDIHQGQSAMLRGVQALLDHELHNGNEEEMKAASDTISKWLRTR